MMRNVFKTWNAFALTGLGKEGELTHRALPYVCATTLSGLKFDNRKISFA